MVAFGLVSMRSRANVEAALQGIDVKKRIVALPPSAHVWRTIWSRAGYPPVERFAGPLDVFHFSDWMYPPQRSGVRSTLIHDLVPLHFPDLVHPRTRRQNLAKYTHAARTCDVIVVNSEYTANDVAEHLKFPRERIVVARPGVDERFTPEGPRHEEEGPYVLMLSPDEPRKNYERLADAVDLVRVRRPELRLLAPDWVDDERAAGALSRCDRVRLPIAVRGLRHADSRGDGVRDACRRVVASIARRGMRRRGQARGPVELRGAGRRDRGRTRRAAGPGRQRAGPGAALHVARVRRGSPSRFRNSDLRHFHAC